MTTWEVYQNIRFTGQIDAGYNPVLVQTNKDGAKVYRIVHNGEVMYVRINTNGSTTWIS